MTLWSSEGWCQRPLWLLSCHSGGTRIAEWNRSKRDKDGRCVSVCDFCAVCLRALRLFVDIQPTQAFADPGISSLAPSGHRDRVLEGGAWGQSVWMCGLEPVWRRVWQNGRGCAQKESAGGEILKCRCFTRLHSPWWRCWMNGIERLNWLPLRTASVQRCCFWGQNLEN